MVGCAPPPIFDIMESYYWGINVQGSKVSKESRGEGG